MRQPVTEMSREQLIDSYLDAVTLIDGCYEVVEVYETESPSQECWKRSWLANARKKHGAIAL